MRANLTTSLGAVCAAAVVAMSLAACGREAAESQETQVAAKVNGDEITIHQVNDALQRTTNIHPEQGEQAQKQVLERLIDQQLLVQQALENKLDRDPKVVTTVEAARRQVLAQAYVEHVRGGAATATGEEVKAFYAEHPQLFQERRVYRFAQVTIVAPGDKHHAIRARLEELDRQADKAKVLPQLADWLAAQKIKFRVAQITQAAEQLPLEALPKYHQMKDGDLVISPSAQGVVVSQLTASQTQPLNESQAQPFIEQFLQHRARLKLAEAEMKRLRENAKIEYSGDFARAEEASPPDNGEVRGSAKQTLPEDDSDAASDRDVISRGIKSLK